MDLMAQNADNNFLSAVVRARLSTYFYRCAVSQRLRGNASASAVSSAAPRMDSAKTLRACRLICRVAAGSSTCSLARIHIARTARRQRHTGLLVGLKDAESRRTRTGQTGPGAASAAGPPAPARRRRRCRSPATSYRLRKRCWRPRGPIFATQAVDSVINIPSMISLITVAAHQPNVACGSYGSFIRPWACISFFVALRDKRKHHLHHPAPPPQSRATRRRAGPAHRAYS